MRKSTTLLVFVLAFAAMCGCTHRGRPAETTEVEPLTVSALEEVLDQTPDAVTGLHAYSFRSFTLMQTLDKAAAVGVKAIQMHPGQVIGGGLDGRTDPSMPPDVREAVLDRLKSAGVSVCAYGVATPLDERGWVPLFEFCKAMSIPTLCTQAAPDELNLVEELAEEYGVNVALWNSTAPSPYWNPSRLLKACQGRGLRIGACADVGNWTRSGLDPVDCLRTLQGRLMVVHLKDVDAASRSGNCVALGKGVCNMPAVLAELKQQAFAGPRLIAFDGLDNPYAQALQSADYVAKCMAMSAEKLLAGDIPESGMVTDIHKVWALADPADDGLWKIKVEEVDTSDYVDTTDDGKGSVEACGDGFPGEHYPNAFDNSQAKWCIEMPQVWIQYKYPEGVKHKVTAYTITTANDAPERDPKDWRLMGSDDGKKWFVIDERESVTWNARFQKRLFKVKKPGEYNIYKLDVTKNSGNSGTTQLSEIELLEDKPD